MSLSTEPLLSTAIGKLQEQAKCSSRVQQKELNYFTDAKSINGVQKIISKSARRYFESIELIIKCDKR
jgi:hypothetical protein